MPIDFEIFLAEENHKLYKDPAAQKKLFDQTVPVVHFLETLFRSRGMPYILDYTPSGAHILFQNLLGYSTSEELQKIGYLENDLIKACNYIDPNDMRRWYGISLMRLVCSVVSVRLLNILPFLPLKLLRKTSQCVCFRLPSPMFMITV